MPAERPHPRPTPPAPDPRPGPEPERQSALDETITERVRALPGTLTYLDLIKKNKRDSVLLIGLMVGLAALVGGLGGGVIAPAVAYRWESSMHPDDVLSQEIWWSTPALIGAATMLVLTLITAVWSWFGGDRAVLRAMHARELEPYLDPELFNVVDEMRLAAGIPMPRVYLIPESALNAFATGRDPEHGAVAITTGLRAKLTRDELQGVMAHEIAHIRHLDIRFSMLMSAMVGLLAVISDGVLRGTAHASVGSRGGSRGSGKGNGGAAVLVALALVLAVVAPFIASAIQFAFSRQREYLADAGAVELTRNPRGLASALRKLAADREPLVETANRGTAHMFIMNPLRRGTPAAKGTRGRNSRHNRSSVFSSHPPVAERIARLEALDR